MGKGLVLFLCVLCFDGVVAAPRDAAFLGVNTDDLIQAFANPDFVNNKLKNESLSDSQRQMLEKTSTVLDFARKSHMADIVVKLLSNPDTAEKMVMIANNPSDKLAAVTDASGMQNLLQETTDAPTPSIPMTTFGTMAPVVQAIAQQFAAQQQQLADPASTTSTPSPDVVSGDVAPLVPEVATQATKDVDGEVLGEVVEPNVVVAAAAQSVADQGVMGSTPTEGAESPSKSVSLLSNTPCTLPSTLGSNIQWASGTSCELDGSLADGSTCNVECVAGSVASDDSATTTFTCTSGSLVAPTLVCSAPSAGSSGAACTLPSTVGNNLEFASGQSCVAGGSLASGDSCNVQCVAGFTLEAAAAYSCLDGVLTTPAMNCIGDACTMPGSLPTNTQISTGQSCSVGAELGHGQSCALECTAGSSVADMSGLLGYSCTSGILSSPTTSCSTTTAACSLPDPLPSNYEFTAGSSCSLGGSLSSGSVCTVQCTSGTTGDEGSTMYSCAAGSLTAPTLTCTSAPADCTMPSSLPTNTQVASGQSCGVNTPLTSGSTCILECSGSTTASSVGTIEYSCTDGALTAPTITCSESAASASASCTMPDTLPSNTQVSSGQSCGVGTSLTSGSSCTLECVAGSTASVSGAIAYTCDNGALTAPTPVCSVPSATCTLPSTPPAGMTFSGCAAGSELASGSQCAMACASGFDQQGSGSVNYECVDGALTVPGITCVDVNSACSLPDTLPAGMALTDHSTCTLGGPVPLGGSCHLQCIDGSTPGSMSTFAYGPCGSGGSFPAPTLTCTNRACELPMSLPSNTQFTAAAAASGCQVNSGSSDTYIANGATCNVECVSPTVSAGSGTTQYSCDNGVLTVPSISCVAPEAVATATPTPSPTPTTPYVPDNSSLPDNFLTYVMISVLVAGFVYTIYSVKKKPKTEPTDPGMVDIDNLPPMKPLPDSFQRKRRQQQRGLIEPLVPRRQDSGGRREAPSDLSDDEQPAPKRRHSPRASPSSANESQATPGAGISGVGVVAVGASQRDQKKRPRRNKTGVDGEGRREDVAVGAVATGGARQKRKARDSAAERRPESSGYEYVDLRDELRK